MKWDAPEVEALRAGLPPNQKLRPIDQLPRDALANLRACYAESGWPSDEATVGAAATPEVALEDLQIVASSLDYLPPLCPPQLVTQLSHELTAGAARHLRWAESAPGTCTCSPSSEQVRKLLADGSGSLRLAQHVFQLLVDVTRLPEGSVAPGPRDCPPARVTLRQLSGDVASTLGEPMHTDLKASGALPECAAMQRTVPPRALPRRPRLVWSFDKRNPLRVTSWRARACLETEPSEVGGGIVIPEALRCDPPYLHEGLTTNLDGGAVGARLQLVTDPDYFNTHAAAALISAATLRLVAGDPTREPRPAVETRLVRS